MQGKADPNYYKKKAENNWLIWRLVFSDNGITYSDAVSMDWDELYEANAALDIVIKQQEKGGKK